MVARDKVRGVLSGILFLSVVWWSGAALWVASAMSWIIPGVPTVVFECSKDSWLCPPAMAVATDEGLPQTEKAAPSSTE